MKILLTPLSKLLISLVLTSGPVYVRLPWIRSLSQLIDDKVSSSVTRCNNAAMVRTIFPIRAEFPSIHKDGIPIFQQSNLINKF